jgi:hypothetical protein
VTGNVGGTCVDSRDHVFIVNRTADEANLTNGEKASGRPAPPVIEFDPGGNVVNSWGDIATFPSGAHTCYFDKQGNVWIGGNTDAIAQRYSHDGKLLLQLGTKLKFDTSDGTVKGKALNASHTLLNGRRPDLPGNGSPWWILFSPDKAQKYLFVSDGSDEMIWTLDRQSGETLSGFGRIGHMAGEFTFLHALAMDSKGIIYTGETVGGRRVQKFAAMN